MLQIKTYKIIRIHTCTHKTHPHTHHNTKAREILARGELLPRKEVNYLTFVFVRDKTIGNDDCIRSYRKKWDVFIA